MTGVLNAMVGATATSRHVVTLGWSGLGGDPVGYAKSPSGVGSISPSSLRGVSIDEAFSVIDADFELWLVGGYAQNHFYSITIEAGDGTQRTYTSASATYQNQGGVRTFWSWGTGSNRVWQQADNGEQHWLIIRF
jgi:hypothetical protein